MKTLLLLLSAGKLGKVFITGGTMVLSIFAYSFIFGVSYAIGLVLLIFIHEMGHFIAAKQKGLDVGVPTFIPFVGAWINLKEQPMNVETEAYVGFAGPFIGTLGTLVCYFLAREYESNLLLALAYAGFFINLFNLIPISPLDGGRITAILSPRIWLVGIPIIIGFFYYYPSPLLIIIVVLAFPQIIKAWKYNPDLPENKSYYNVTMESKVTYFIYYMGLVIFLALMTNNIHIMLSGIRS